MKAYPTAFKERPIVSPIVLFASTSIIVDFQGSFFFLHECTGRLLLIYHLLQRIQKIFTQLSRRGGGDGGGGGGHIFVSYRVDWERGVFQCYATPTGWNDSMAADGNYMYAMNVCVSDIYSTD